MDSLLLQCGDSLLVPWVLLMEPGSCQSSASGAYAWPDMVCGSIPLPANLAYSHSPTSQVPQSQSAIRDFYTSHPSPPTSPSHQVLLTTNVSSALFTSHAQPSSGANMTETSVINHYQQEIEYIRSLQTTPSDDHATIQEQRCKGAIEQQMRQQSSCSRRANWRSFFLPCCCMP